jgi:hypothetical protein
MTSELVILAMGLIISAISRGKQYTEIFVPVFKLQACVLWMMREIILENSVDLPFS